MTSLYQHIEYFHFRCWTSLYKIFCMHTMRSLPLLRFASTTLLNDITACSDTFAAASTNDTKEKCVQFLKCVQVGIFADCGHVDGKSYCDTVHIRPRLTILDKQVDHNSMHHMQCLSTCIVQRCTKKIVLGSENAPQIVSLPMH